MTSEVSICNGALTMLGSDLIIALSDDNKRGRVLNSIYARVRDAEYDRHRWRFTFQRASLPELSTTPAFDFSHQYQLPSDYIRLVNGGDILSIPDQSDYRTYQGEDWSIEGGMILSFRTAPLRIRYIARITDTALMPPSFAEALSARLAFEACEALTQSDTKKSTVWAQYRNALKEAIRAKALEAAPQSIADDTWVTARASGN